MPDTYRLVTRSDFDGLVCAALLKELGMLDDILFVHPKDVQDGKVELTANDITTNPPYSPEGALSFDHHSSEDVRVTEDAEIAWAEGFDLIRGETVLVPYAAAAYYQDRGQFGPPCYALTSTNGLASGNTVREATVLESRDSPLMDALTSAGESLKVVEIVSMAFARFSVSTFSLVVVRSLNASTTSYADTVRFSGISLPGSS